MATEAMARLSRANPLGGVSHSVTGIQISPGSDDAHGFGLIFCSYVQRRLLRLKTAGKEINKRQLIFFIKNGKNNAEEPSVVD